jgi:hypothetical protein
MLSLFKLRRTTFSIAASVLLMAGCHPAMSAQTDARIAPPAQTHAVPLKFKQHNFEAVCYNTIGCTVVYNNRPQAKHGADEVSGPPKSKDYKKTWGSVETGIRNFPAPAEVTWKSLDGVAHEAKVDIGSIFKDELVWHDVPKSDMTDFYAGPVAGAPDIYLEVNDRTINVYMAMLVPTKAEQIPGNKDSDFRKDVILAWSQTF